MLATDQNPLIRKSGRPRTFTDFDVFVSISRVLSTADYTRLTFALVADEVGCTTSALIRRYGSKQDLLIGYLEWVAANVNHNFDLFRRMYESPMDVIRALMLLPARNPPNEALTRPIASPGTFTSFFVSARSDPAYRPIIGRIAREFETRIESLLHESIAAGEIRPCDTCRLAHLITIAYNGAVTWWFDLEAGDLECEVERALELVLEPHLP